MRNLSEIVLTPMGEYPIQEIDNLAAEKQQATDEGNLWFDLVCALISENSDPDLLRRALDAVQEESA